MNKWDIKKQRALARSLVYELTGKKIRHSKTGRPLVGRSMDISISHKNDLAGVGIVPLPYRIGIDIEHLKVDLNNRLFIGPVITNKEVVFLKKLCSDNNLSISSGIAVFWSIKESFFKCLDYDLKPGKISILNISKSGAIRICLSEEIKNLMARRRLAFVSSKVVFADGYSYSETIMKERFFSGRPCLFNIKFI